jgi:hypothetical protein
MELFLSLVELFLTLMVYFLLLGEFSRSSGTVPEAGGGDIDLAEYYFSFSRTPDSLQRYSFICSVSAVSMAE